MHAYRQHSGSAFGLVVVGLVVGLVAGLAAGCRAGSQAGAPVEAGVTAPGDPADSTHAAPAAPTARAGAPVRCPGVTADAAARMQRALRDPSDRFRGAYPASPALTCEILRGLDAELADPQVRARFESLSAERWANHPPLADVIDSLGRDSRRYPLIALSTHWNTDVKILALRAFQRVPSRLLINADASTEAALAETERAALRFLLVAVETTPRMISGSENATIHGIYMDALIATLDLLSGERGPAGALRTNAMTEPEFTAAVASWRRHAGQ